MATIKQKEHKNGDISYEIRVSLGRDISGKQILKYSTWKPERGMTARQIEKAVQKHAVLFEEACLQGKVLDSAIRFADFAEEWLKANEGVHAPSYQIRARSLLDRIIPAIGHMKLSELKPHHLQAFYKNLAEKGVRIQRGGVTSATLKETMSHARVTRAQLCAASGVSMNTISAARSGKQIGYSTACNLAAALGKEVGEVFTVTSTTERLSPSTISHHHKLLSSILETAVKWQVIYDNPARRVTPPKAQRKEARYLDDQQALAVINALEDEDIKWRAIIMTFMYSGMRRGELCGLSWEDIDFENGVVHINKTSQYLPDRGVFDKETKTKSSNRVIKLPDELFTLLKRYRAHQAQQRLLLADRWLDSGKVFTQDNGKPIHPDSITSWVSKFTTKHNLPRFSPHSLRHTNATLLIMSGVPVKAVSSRLGHADQNITNAVYSHTIQTVDAMASDIIGDVLSPAKATAENRTKEKL